MIRFFLLTAWFAFESLAQIAPTATCPAYRGSIDDYFDFLGAQCPQNREFEGESTEPMREDFSTGQVTTSLGTGEDIARAGRLRSDGRLVVAGRTYNGTNSDIYLVRYLPSGKFDPSFGTGGRVLTAVGTGEDVAHAVFLETNGNTAISGVIQVGSTFQFLLARYQSNGSLDTSFMTVGYRTLSVSASVDISRTLQVDTAGRYWLSGYGAQSGRWALTLARFISNGALDTSFRTQGYFTSDPLSNAIGGLTSALDSLGQLLLGGTGVESSNWKMVAFRYLTDGTLDTSFATRGYLTISFGTATNQAYSVAALPAGYLLVGAAGNGTNLDVALAKLNSNGDFDTSFSTTGRLLRSFSTGDDAGYAVEIEDGTASIIISGYGTRTDKDFLVARFTSQGTLDTLFSTVGYLLKSLGTGDDLAVFLVRPFQSSVLAGGRLSRALNNNDIGFVRWNRNGDIGASGSFDFSFGALDGFSSVAHGGASPRNYAINFDQAQNVIAGGRIDTNKGALLRWKPWGVLDTSFATVGYTSFSLNSATLFRIPELDPQGRIVINAQRTGTGVTLLRFTSNGALDTSFRTVGWASYTDGTSVGSIALYTDGRIVITSTLGVHAMVGRIHSNGLPDTSFRTVGFGRFVSNGSFHMGKLDDDRLILYRPATYYFHRITSNGILDTSFNTTGTVWDTGYWSSTQSPLLNIADNKVSAALVDGGGNIAVHRRTTNGDLDPSFATAGRQLLSFDGEINYNNGGRTFSNPDGYYTTTDYINTAGTIYGARLQRTGSDGLIDTAFGTLGIARSSSKDSDNSDAPELKLSPHGRACIFFYSEDFYIGCFNP